MAYQFRKNEKVDHGFENIQKHKMFENIIVPERREEKSRSANYKSLRYLESICFLKRRLKGSNYNSSKVSQPKKVKYSFCKKPNHNESFCFLKRKLSLRKQTNP